MPEVKVGVAVFIMKDGKFLMGKRKGSHGDGTWSVPGGALEYGESFAVASKREVLEETGVLIENLGHIATTNDFFESENKHYITIWMVADWKAGTPIIREPNKCSELDWFDANTMPQPLFQPCWENYFKATEDLYE